MILSQLQKYITTRVLFPLFLTLVVSACGNDASKGSSENTENSDRSSRADINLSWVAPSERDNNEPISLSEIAGYKVYYGTEQRNYRNMVDIKDGTAEGYTLKNISAGTYYFALTTYDTAGRESQYSAEIKIVV